MQTGDLIRGSRGAAALVIETKDDGLHVVTTRGAAVWPVAEYQECERPPVGLLRSATAKAETLTKQRDEALAKIQTQRDEHETRKERINTAAIKAGDSHGIGQPLDTLLHKHGMPGRPRTLQFYVQVRFRAVMQAQAAQGRNVFYDTVPWAYNLGDTEVVGIWSHLMQLRGAPQANRGMRDLVIPLGQDLNTECPCEEARQHMTPAWALQWYQSNFVGRSSAWAVECTEIGTSWVVDPRAGEHCRHHPRNQGVFQSHVPEPTREEVK